MWLDTMYTVQMPFQSHGGKYLRELLRALTHEHFTLKRIYTTTTQTWAYKCMHQRSVTESSLWPWYDMKYNHHIAMWMCHFCHKDTWRCYACNAWIYETELKQENTRRSSKRNTMTLQVHTRDPRDPREWCPCWRPTRDSDMLSWSSSSSFRNKRAFFFNRKLQRLSWNFVFCSNNNREKW